MKLTKEQLDQLEYIFNSHFRENFSHWALRASFPAVVEIVEAFLDTLDQAPNKSVLTDEEIERLMILLRTDSSTGALGQKPALDGSEPIGDETIDQYLDRLVKEASPAWEGVDPEKFMDEVRGRVPLDEAISLLRSLADLQNGPPLETYREQWERTMAAVHEFLRKNEV